MKLSKRLELVASFVPRGSRVADIGTDHGYIPIYLTEEGICAGAVAADVREGPLCRAREHIRERGLESRIQVRLSDGLKEIGPDEADTVVIAGMGGQLVIHILEDGRHMWDTVKTWILSPQSELDKVRRYLEEQGFFISREAMTLDEGKYYTVMGVRREDGDSEDCRKCGALRNGEAPRNGEVPQNGEALWGYEKPWEYLYGKLLIAEKNPVLLDYLCQEEGRLKGILKALEVQDTPGARTARETAMEQLTWIKEAKDAM